MIVISLVSRKGGVGKTTLTLGLGVLAAQQGRQTLCVDLDPQGSLAALGRERDKRGLDAPAVVEARPEELHRLLAGARRQGYSLALLDTPPTIGGAADAAIAESDLCVVPLKPSPLDLVTARDTLALIRRAGKPFLTVATQAKPRTRLTLETVAALAEIGLVGPTLYNRDIFAAATVDGSTPTEVDPNGPAALELRALLGQINALTKQEAQV